MCRKTLSGDFRSFESPLDFLSFVTQKQIHQKEKIESGIGSVLLVLDIRMKVIVERITEHVG